jgi:hypothetical protein
MLAAVLFSFFFSMPSYVVRHTFTLTGTVIWVPNMSVVWILYSHLLPSREGIDSYAKRSSISGPGNTTDLCGGSFRCFSHYIRILCESLATVDTSPAKLTRTYSFHSSFSELLWE